MLDRSLLTACLAAFLTAYQSPAYAVALRPGKVTDATVCDLAPNTIGFLGGSLLIPAAAAKAATRSMRTFACPPRSLPRSVPTARS